MVMPSQRMGIKVLNNSGQWGEKTCNTCGLAIDDYAVAVYAFRGRGTQGAQSGWIHRDCLKQCTADTEKTKRTRCVICKKNEVTHTIKGNNIAHRVFGLHKKCLDDLAPSIVSNEKLKLIISKRKQAKALRNKNKTSTTTERRLEILNDVTSPFAMYYLHTKFRHEDGKLMAMYLILPKIGESDWSNWSNRQCYIIYSRRGWRWHQSSSQHSAVSEKHGTRLTPEEVLVKTKELYDKNLLTSDDHKLVAMYIRMFNHQGDLNCQDGEHKMFHIIGQPCPCLKEL